MRKPGQQEFEAFVAKIEPDLRRALFAVLGVERGREATAEALAWAWEHWSRTTRPRQPDRVPVPCRTEPQSASEGASCVRQE